jgi:hypothetical protein
MLSISSTFIFRYHSVILSSIVTVLHFVINENVLTKIVLKVPSFIQNLPFILLQHAVSPCFVSLIN